MSLKKSAQLSRGGVLAAIAIAQALLPSSAHAFVLNLLHFSDSESSLLPRAGESLGPQPPAGTNFNFGGAALFANGVQRQRMARSDDFELLVTGGDNFLAGPQFEASLNLPAGEPFFDTRALERFDLDVGGIGNHEFDFGPEVLARFLDPDGDGQAFRPFVSANLSIPEDSPLKGLIQESTIVTKTVNGETRRVGVVGATTPRLATISSPGEVEAIGDEFGQPGFEQLVSEIQQEVDRLQQAGVEEVVLLSHLQNLDEERQLPGRLEGVDVIVAAGSDTLLASEEDPLLPLDGQTAVPTYPLIYDSATGEQVTALGEVQGAPVLIVATEGQYSYLGNLQVEFTNGLVTSILEPASGPQAIATLTGLEPDPAVAQAVEEPVAAFVANLRENIVGTTEIPLDSLRENVRTRSTFGGSLIADAIRDAARDGAATVSGLDAEEILVGIQNGGGIRNDLTFEPGDEISEFDTFEILPFTNFVTVVEDITGNELQEILERSVAGLPAAEGQFLQLSGLEVVYDLAQGPQLVSVSGEITSLGARVQSILLDPDNDRRGQFLYTAADGFLVDPERALFDLATINFTAAGGDNFVTLANIPEDRKITLGGITYQFALEQYIVNELGGTIAAADIASGEGIRVRSIDSGIPLASGGEILIPEESASVPEPSSVLVLLGLGILGGTGRWRAVKNLLR